MGYTLIICEKPNAASKIARALAEGKPTKKEKDGAPYYQLKRGGKDIVVVPAVGHLFILDEVNTGSKWSYPVLESKWVPTFKRKGNQWAEKYYRNIEALVKGATDFVSACDFDTEGSVIAYNIIRYICKAQDGKRMQYSTLTPEDLVKSYEQALPHLDYPQIEAGLARHKMDWLFGINLTRALTLSLEHVGGYWILSTGRVQGPTLNILNERQKEINAFKPTPYWQFESVIVLNGQELEAEHKKDRFLQEVTAKNVLQKCQGKNGVVTSVEKREVNTHPPVPFDLTSLQRESYNHFGYSPKQTLDFAQHLYEQALISYPRTSSQKLPAKLGFQAILKELSQQPEYAPLTAKLLQTPLKPNEGKKTDSAHPAIFPTGHKPNVRLASYHKKLYDLIVRRFFAVFGNPGVREQVRVDFTIEGEPFVTHGSRTVKLEWMEYYKPYINLKEQHLPEIKSGDVVQNKKLILLSKQTEPPSHYSQASILKEMESHGLGTKATRAQILDTLYQRSYIKDKSITVTQLGKSVVDALQKYAPQIISFDLTGKWDEKMDAIEKGTLKKDIVVAEAKKELETILTQFKTNEQNIGNFMRDAVREYEKVLHTVGTCPVCGNGELRILHSHRTRKRFVGCSNYPKCTNSFPLPQHGYIQAIEKTCFCGLFLIEVRPNHKRPWNFCVKDGFNYKKKDDTKGDPKTHPAQQKPQKTIEPKKPLVRTEQQKPVTVPQQTTPSPASQPSKPAPKPAAPAAQTPTQPQKQISKKIPLDLEKTLYEAETPSEELMTKKQTTPSSSQHNQSQASQPAQKKSNTQTN